jgi:hypothetical protein
MQKPLNGSAKLRIYSIFRYFNATREILFYDNLLQ